MKVGDTVYFEDLEIRHCYYEGTLDFLSDKLAVISFGLGGCFVECIRLNDPQKILAGSKAEFYDKCIGRMVNEIDKLDEEVAYKRTKLGLLRSIKDSET